jgi:broad specificity phosphatase PhoE
VVADLAPSRVAVLVTHGGTSVRLLEALLDLGPEHRRIFGPLGNCAWTEVVPQGSRWRVLRHNWSPLGALPAQGAGAGREGLEGATAEGAGPPAQDADAVA